MPPVNHFLEPDEEPTRTEPLDPVGISMGTHIMTVQQVIDRLVNNRLIAVEFPRNQHIWNTQAKSRLIESLLLQFPLPHFYIDATNEQQWLVIDGMQRILTFYQFIIEQSFSLNGLDYFGDLHGKYFSELSPRWQRRIKQTKLNLYLILRGSSQEIAWNIFNRINCSSLPSSVQEFRYNKYYPGKAIQLLSELAESPEFKEVVDIKNNQMIFQECILRILSLISSDINTLNFKDYDYFLDNKMNELNQLDDNEIELLKHRFIRIVNIVYHLFANQAFRKPSQSQQRYCINRGFLESWCFNLDKLDDEQIQILKSRQHSLFEILLQTEFDIYKIKGDSNHLKQRLQHTQGIINAVINSIL
jgi:hypothetical protein